MAQEFSPLGLTVNLISPGLIGTARQGRSADRPDHHKHHAPWSVVAARPSKSQPWCATS